ncbi:MAG: hypothetical protein CBC13_08245 [Planctomycetia bacterium TMED53]|nr:MAG: hypothetical protein CBC13_08245 [Planctomycetia bacterium TMED53]
MEWFNLTQIALATTELTADAGWFETLKYKLTADLWVWFGLGAQSIFFARWLVQWIASERKGESTIPVAFWWCSILGGVGLFIYAWRNVDLPIMLAQAAGILMYSRNLYLIYKPKTHHQPNN